MLRDLSKNQEETDKRINDYTFTRKVTERELDDKGVLKKEKVTVYEVYPFVGYGWVEKLVSENGFVDALQKPVAELAMDPHRTVDNVSPYLVFEHLSLFLGVLGALGERKSSLPSSVAPARIVFRMSLGYTDDI